jgi:hypothetical protein
MTVPLLAVRDGWRVRGSTISTMKLSSDVHSVLLGHSKPRRSVHLREAVELKALSVEFLDAFLIFSSGVRADEACGLRILRRLEASSSKTV